MSEMTPEVLTGVLNKKGKLSPRHVTSFRSLVYGHYHAILRSMPWRETSDPYHILVSELMLQQTQVERVRIKYAEFLHAFPTVHTLAAAALADVLQVWQGLGYNRRALFLKRCAEEIVSFYAGQFPRSIEELQSLPGIGPYTARAVAAFAFGVAEPLIETNIRTVFIHYFFHGSEKVTDSELMPLIAATLDRDNPREWYYALMDFGVMLKQTHPNPGRRSKHHTTQSRFEGSNRQLRSRILREVMEHRQITPARLIDILAAEQDSVLNNLEVMVREGLLSKQGRNYRISG
jgi:A/G-specific adenine glycosylase